MRLDIPCLTCLMANADRLETKFYDIYRQADLRDDDRYTHTCPKGHVTDFLLTNPRFEVLFEVGLNAIVDGYPREAVNSFAGSLERFQEFAIRVLIRRVDPGSEVIDFMWKPLARQSERQLGAFVSLWVSGFKAMPRLQSQGDIEFRNGVIHRGALASIGDATAYGERMLAIIRDNSALLRASHAAEIATMAQTKLDQAKRLIDGVAPSGYGLGTLASLAAEPDIGLIGYLEQLEARRRLMISAGKR